MLFFLAALAGCSLIYFTIPALSLAQFYGLLAVIGFFAGYWAVLMAMVTEQFGTNLRATAATTVPNFVRGSVVLMTLALGVLKPLWGLAHGSLAIGTVVLLGSLAAVWALPESFDKELDYLER